MTPITDRIAGVSLTTVVLILALLTAARAWLVQSRAPVLRSCADFLESVVLAITLVFLLLRPFVVQSFFIPSGSMLPTLREGDHILVNKWVYRMAPPGRGDVVVFRAPRQASADEKDFIKRVIGVGGDVIQVAEGFVTVDGQTYTRDRIESFLLPDGRTPSVDEQLGGSARPVDGTDDDVLLGPDGFAAEPPRLRLTTDAVWIGERRVNPEEFAAKVGKPGAKVVIQPGRVLRNGEVLIEPYAAEDPAYHMDPQTVPAGQLFVMGDNRNDSLDSRVWGPFPARRVVGRADLVFWPPSHLKRVRSGGH